MYLCSASMRLPVFFYGLGVLVVFGCAETAPPELQRGTFRLAGEELELEYDLAGGRMIFEHDIVLEPEDEIRAGEGRSIDALLAASSSGSFWPRALVHYTIDSSV